MAKKDFDKGANVDFKNVKLKWVKVDPNNPDEYKNSKKWCIDIVLDPSDAKDLKKMGFNVKTDKDGEEFIRAIRKTVTAKGPQTPPMVFDRDGKTQLDTEGLFIGNGSMANVKTLCKKWDTGTFISVYLNKMQMIDIVEGSDSFDDLDGDGQSFDE